MDAIEAFVEAFAHRIVNEDFQRAAKHLAPWCEPAASAEELRDRVAQRLAQMRKEWSLDESDRRIGRVRLSNPRKFNALPQDGLLAVAPAIAGSAQSAPVQTGLRLAVLHCPNWQRFVRE